MTIAQNIQLVRENIEAACSRAHRTPDTVTLVAVSKTQPAEAILEALETGVQHFGENRVEEAVDKIPQVQRKTDQAVTWHMIGHVQSRKAKDIPPLFQVVHSVDSLKLAEKLSHLMSERGALLDILIEVNVSGEVSKSGFSAYGWEPDTEVRERFLSEFSALQKLDGLRIRGLMTMAPIVEDAEQARPVFSSLAALREVISERIGFVLPDLSMGMTDDYAVAIEEGATLVRIGRAIFGDRKR